MNLWSNVKSQSSIGLSVLDKGMLPTVIDQQCYEAALCTVWDLLKDGTLLSLLAFADEDYNTQSVHRFGWAAVFF